MNPIIAQFEFLSDVSDKIDMLIEQSEKTRKHSEKKELIRQAKELIWAYETHTGQKKLFKNL